MGFSRCAARDAVALCLILLLTSLSVGTAFAQASTSISGTVVASGKPVPNAKLTLSGNNLTLQATTNAAGAFRFNGLSVGSYTVTTAADNGTPISTQVDLTSSGANVTIETVVTQEIGRITSSIVSPPVARQSGTDFVTTNTQIERSAYVNTLPNILLQVPAAARGSNGQVHINGDHNGLNYYIDGVQVPEGLNRVLGNEIDPADIGFMEVIEGAYPAQYGDRFAGVVNISSKSQTGPTGATLQAAGGSYNAYDGIFGFHTPVGSGGGLYFGAREASNSWSLDPPVTDPVHNAGSVSSQFLRFAIPSGNDNLSFLLTHSLQTFQLPPDTGSGTPAITNDNEIQEDTLATLIDRHTFGENAVLTYGMLYKRSRLLDTNDLNNDLIGQIAGPQAAPCTDFSNCSFFSVNADRTDINTRFVADYSIVTGKHEIRVGGLYGAETLQKNYVMTVPATTPDGSMLTPFTVVDNAPNAGHTQQFYIQDGWQPDAHFRLDYGVRSDSFQVFSTDFDNGFAQWSPRVKATYIFNRGANVYAYYGRLFVPFSLESVSPVAAAMLYVPPSVTTNDLKPQRDSLYEFGGHLPLGGGELGVRISHKVSTDWLDDTQVGATNLHQDINFPLGEVNSQTLYYNQQFGLGSRFYVSASHVTAVNSMNCETELLQNCAALGPPGGDFVQADHDQHYDASAGLLVNDRHRGWFSMNSEYGSGLSRGDTTLCPPFPLGDALNCKVPPHLTFDIAKGFAFGRHNQVAIAIQNLLNDQYAITLNSSLQGTHYAKPRSVELRFFFGGT